jgi:hypothetical protein
MRVGVSRIDPMGSMEAMASFAGVTGLSTFATPRVIQASAFPSSSLTKRRISAMASLMVQLQPCQSRVIRVGPMGDKGTRACRL